MSGVMTGAGPWGYLDPESAISYTFTAAEQEVLPAIRSSQVHGVPDEVADQLGALVKRFTVDELMIVCPIVDSSDRIQSYQLVAAQTL